jgi:small subunit ribosomal protein S9
MADDETREPEQPDEEAAVEPEAQAPESETSAEPQAETPAEPEAATPEEPQAQDEPAVEASDDEVVIEAVVEEDNVIAEVEEDDAPEQPRVKPEIPGADLEVDIVREGVDPLTGEERPLYDEDGEPVSDDDAEEDDIVEQPIAAATIDLAAGARYSATGKRKTAVARVILKPGTGAYTINGKELDTFFPRTTLQRQIRQPLEAVGYEERMDVVARMHGGGVSSQAGALRHGISRALLEADPNLRSELKRRGFLTRDARVKERKKAGLKKARKRPQFSKR